MRKPKKKQGSRRKQKRPIQTGKKATCPIKKTRSIASTILTERLRKVPPVKSFIHWAIRKKVVPSIPKSPLKIPSSYDEIKDLVEELVRMKSMKFSKGFLAAEDIAQEIRIKCANIFKSFDPTKGQSLKTYLNVCTERYLYNLMRDKFSRFDPPCKRHNHTHFDKSGLPTKDADNCPIFRTYLLSYKAKNNIRLPWQLIDGAPVKNTSHSEVEAIDLSMSIRDRLERIDFSLVRDYERLLAGYEISAENLNLIREITKEIVAETSPEVNLSRYTNV